MEQKLQEQARLDARSSQEVLEERKVVVGSKRRDRTGYIAQQLKRLKLDEGEDEDESAEVD